ncbi:MAG TPA: Gfo/Idh/MocA family oxidoreductase, partial [Candidatus Hydrogenedentes bacterium]|nr:Gfo/Idh/MocA family oxidoreductase [Candidatus Hydrogenedentota bacterium]
MLKKTSRRTFLKRTAMAAAPLLILSGQTRGEKKRSSAHDRLNIACVGLGGIGTGNAGRLESENIVALCDVDTNQMAKSAKRFPKATLYQDFRIMLDKQKDIDAVMIATPDHNHAVVTMAAMQRGKHVYCEKPLTHSVREARMIAEAAAKYGVVTQMGIQGHAHESLRLLCEWIWDGAIGDVHEVHAWTPHPVWPQGIDRPADTPPVPESLDWDLWLGPAPSR